MKKNFLSAMLVAAVLLTGCFSETTGSTASSSAAIQSTVTASSAGNNSSLSASTTASTYTPTSSEAPKSLINVNTSTLSKRISVPSGYKRTKAKKGSFAQFLRNYELKPDGSPVLLYNGKEKGNQNAHIAVFKLPIENEDLQQCADSIMRIYGEYYFGNKEYGKIKFPLGTGFIADFDKWRSGYSIKVSGNSISWVKASKNDSSYDSFKRFMRIVFAYSGTLNMDGASTKITLDEAKTGDIFIKGGSPGHVVMIVDECKRSDGRRAFLLAQGYMPAQEFHVLKNPLHPDDPWYYEEEITFPFVTPEYIFGKGSLRRYK